MNKFVGPALSVLLFLCFLGFFGWAFYAETQPDKISADIAVVVYGGENSGRWKSLEQGIGQACSELGIEKPVLVLARTDDPGNQSRLLRREVENGAQGLLVAVGDNSLSAYIDEISGNIPVVALESGGGDVPCISADNALMGREMADRAAAHTGNIAVLAEGLSRSSISARFDAFMERMNELDRPVTVIAREGGGDDLKAFIASSLANNRLNLEALVVLDNETLEVAIDAAPASMVEVSLYGIGNSSKVVHALDQGIVDEILFQNEYAIGYIGTMTLAEKMGLAGPAEPMEIQYSFVRRENMYDPANERLLFPIIQ